MRGRSLRRATAPALIALLLGVVALNAGAEPTGRLAARGKYLVTIMGCGDCHTPGYFLGKPDFAHALSGSDVGFEIPGLGTFVAPNLTPDKETGLGNWTDKQIVAAITTGKRPDGRMLAPIMPWRDFAALTSSDAQAVAVYLKSLQPIGHKVPGPFGPTEKPTVFVMKVVPPQP
jgi:mono/diheme cytochrome c family protein